ncbi:hypothetical protein, partial [Nitrososphaera sp.]|uniref:hypothetical protein n=1 Tax=Nitrososphaera sp. TaxID=1971748 RepID=UPI002ED99DD7
VPPHVRYWIWLIIRGIIIACAVIALFWAFFQFDLQYKNFQHQIRKVLVDPYVIEIANPLQPHDNMKLSINMFSRYVSAQSGVDAYVTLYPDHEYRHTNQIMNSTLPEVYYLYFDNSNCEFTGRHYGIYPACYAELVRSSDYANYTGYAYVVFPHMGEYEVRLTESKSQTPKSTDTLGLEPIIVESMEVNNDLVAFRLSTNIALLSTAMAGIVALIGIITSSFFRHRLI